MDVVPFVTTARLLIRALAAADSAFIFELLNTEGWLKFIGNRNITSAAAASTYIHKILDNKKAKYWVVQLLENNEKIGVVTFIKKDYLAYRDIGFAFLPAYYNQGYAHEAVQAVLHQLIRTHNVEQVLATTFLSNKNSIKLLKKLRFQFEKEIQITEGTLQVYSATAEQLKI